MVLSPTAVATREKISVSDATKVYTTKNGPVHALEGVSVSIAEGEFVCILGPSGCGKTTLLWAMSGLHALTRGRILLDGRPVTGPRPNEIGLIFQEANLLPWRNLEQNIRFPFEIRRTSPDEENRRAPPRDRAHRVRACVPPRAVGWDAAAGVDRARPRQDPAVLLMDEPFGALDAFTRDEMNLLLLRLWAESGKTIVFVTHNISEAIFLGDRVIVLTPRPGRLARIFEIDLPRPRTIEMSFEPGFIAQIQEIKRVVESGGGHGLEVE